jgi:hypothetical protein
VLIVTSSVVDRVPVHCVDVRKPGPAQVKVEPVDRERRRLLQARAGVEAEHVVGQHREPLGLARPGEGTLRLLEHVVRVPAAVGDHQQRRRREPVDEVLRCEGEQVLG